MAAKVKRTGKKAIIEDIPMVNQGSKGYCAIASMERVLRHYGNDIDMHDLANLANSYGGTKPEEMKRAVHVVAGKLRLTARYPMFMKPKDFKSLADQYNRIAAKSDSISKTDSEREGGDLFRVADNKTLKDIRMKSSDFAKFKQEIVSDINRGIPIMWALYLGLFWEDQIEDSYEANRYATNPATSAEDKKNSEWLEKYRKEQKEEMKKLRETTPRPPEHMQGGHMRLIIGYDGDEGVIFYTDSWGPGHEVKKMKIEDAYAATLSMMVIEPR